MSSRSSDIWGLRILSSDDINKFLWMVRIGGSTPEGADIKESDYTPSGEFRIDSEGSNKMLNCHVQNVLLQICSSVHRRRRPPGYDRVRNARLETQGLRVGRTRGSLHTWNTGSSEFIRSRTCQTEEAAKRTSQLKMN